MIPRATRPRGRGAVEPEGRKIQILHEEIDHTNRVILVHPVLQPLGKQRGLIPRDALDEPRHSRSHPLAQGYNGQGFSHSLGRDCS